MRTPQLVAFLLLGMATSVIAPITEPLTPSALPLVHAADLAHLDQHPTVASNPLPAGECTAGRPHASPLDTGAGAPSAPSTVHMVQRPVCPTPNLRTPHRLYSAAADVIVRVRGSVFCTGTPIARTGLVVTAAHCVLDTNGRVAATHIVLADGSERAASAVFIDLDYHDAPSPRLDAAVLVMAETLPGPAALIGDQLPEHGSVTVAGLQPIDTDGSLLRGTTVLDRPQPQRATGPVVRIDSAPAGCILDRAELIVTDHLSAPCGLIPGASGGGLFAERGEDIVLLGIISTVANDLTSNGLTPTATIHALLADPRTYRHELPPTRPHSSTKPADRW